MDAWKKNYGYPSQLTNKFARCTADNNCKSILFFQKRAHVISQCVIASDGFMCCGAVSADAWSVWRVWCMAVGCGVIYFNTLFEIITIQIFQPRPLRSWLHSK